MMKIFLLLFLSSTIYANICLDIKLDDNPFYSFEEVSSIKTFDHTKISANILVPKSRNLKKFPAVVFGNSWLLDEHEYLAQAKILAKKGYAVLSYSLRGWGCSEGVISVVGPEDLEDFSSVLDYLESRSDIDMSNVAVMGISYGAGLSLMAASKDLRVKTAIAFSGWGSLVEALYGNETPRHFWGKLLIYTGELIGNASREVRVLFDNLIRGENVKDVIKWAQKRSPINHIEVINQRNIPILVANNFGDNLFQPNNILSFFKKLTTPKMLVLSQGTHASGEAGGLFGVNNLPFDVAQIWLDYWLKGIDNDIIHGEEIILQTDLKKKIEAISLSQFKTRRNKLYLANDNYIQSGSLQNGPNMKRHQKSLGLGNDDSFATTGIPFVSALIDGNFSFPNVEFLPGLNRFDALVFNSVRFEEDVKIRGNVNLNLNVSSSGKTIQFIAYLYDVNSLRVGKLITHGVFSKRNIESNKTYKINFDLVTTAYDLASGHKLALVIDTHDPLYSDLLDREKQTFYFNEESFLRY